MARSMTACLGALVAGAAFAGFGACGRAQEFSADLATTNTIGQPDDPPGRLYVSNRKVRIETPGVPGGSSLSISTIMPLITCGRRNEYSWRPGGRAD